MVVVVITGTVVAVEIGTVVEGPIEVDEAISVDATTEEVV